MTSWRWWLSRSALPIWAAFVFLLWAGSNELANRALRASLDHVRAEGQPLLPAQAGRPPVPEEDNAAPLFLRAMAVLKPPEGDWDRLDWSRPVDPLSELWVSANAPALDDLRKAAERPSCRFPIDYAKGLSADVPDIAASLRCAELLATAARLAHERGDADEADLLLALLLRLGVALVEEPMLTTSVTGHALFRMGFSLAQSAFDAGLRPGPATRALVHSLQPGLFARAHVATLLLERATLLSFFLGGPAVAPDAPAPFTHRLARWAPLRPWLKRKLSAYCELFRRAVESARDPAPDAWTRPSEDLGPFCRTLLPHFPSLARLAREDDVRADLLRAAVAALEDVETLGTWPTSTPILDRFTGRPLGVSLDAGMLTLHSAGPDGVDDGGDLERDLVFTLGR